ncbi:hypothetical protein [Pelotomaculum propionicicum]|uniref:hypothetical protein n=1 Tax=Pelotomaculum propionicicum TaxID=258475 RepID=UPI003BA3C220
MFRRQHEAVPAVCAARAVWLIFTELPLNSQFQSIEAAAFFVFLRSACKYSHPGRAV